MASEHERLTAEQIDRIYASQIGPALLESIQPSHQPVALLVGGQPGAGKSLAIQRLRSQVRDFVARPVVISSDTLREFHPTWRRPAPHRIDAVNLARHETELWGGRLAREAAAMRANLVFDSSLQRPQDMLALARELNGQGYRVDLLIVASDRDASRLSSVAPYERLWTLGASPHFVSRRVHEQGYEAVRDTLSRLDRGKAAELRISATVTADFGAS